MSLNLFLSTYRTELVNSHAANPKEYAWPIEELDAVFKRMESAIVKGSFNKDSPAFRRTCKALGIKHTYAAIKEFIEKGTAP